jgi:hypothetical protein
MATQCFWYLTDGSGGFLPPGFVDGQRREETAATVELVLPILQGTLV